MTLIYYKVVCNFNKYFKSCRNSKPHPFEIGYTEILQNIWQFRIPEDPVPPPISRHISKLQSKNKVYKNENNE